MSHGVDVERRQIFRNLHCDLMPAQQPRQFAADRPDDLAQLDRLPFRFQRAMAEPASCRAVLHVAVQAQRLLMRGCEHLAPVSGTNGVVASRSLRSRRSRHQWRAQVVADGS